jgi:hypothetical protein
MRAARVLVLVWIVGWSGLSVARVVAQDVDRAALSAALRPAVAADLPEAALAPLETLPHYAFDLTLQDDLSAYTLTETLTFNNRTAKPLADVVLRLFANSERATSITFDAGDCDGTPCRVAQPTPSVIRVQPSAALAPHATLRIRLKLSGKLRPISSEQTDALTQGLEGLGSLLSKTPPSDYGLLSFGDGIASLAQFYAVLAARRGDAWRSTERTRLGDLGADGVSFVRATVHAPRDVRIASSGVISERLSAGDPRQRTVDIAASLVRDFALLASRDFVTRAKQVGDVTVRSHFLARDAVSGEQVLDAAAHALAIFQKRFGPYPYSDLDVVEAALVGGAGGAEFSGLVTVASMLYRPLPVDKTWLGMLGGALGGALEFTTAHEVAHQYWYGLVGSDAREHPAADESLTQWSAQLYFEDRYGSERAQREGDAQLRMNYRMMRGLGEADGAVDRPVDAFPSALAYAGLVYGKGAYFYAALRKRVGDAAYFSALREYARRYRFQLAPATGLVDIVAEGSPRAGEIRALAQHWLLQTHGDRDLGNPGVQGLFAVQGDASPDLRALESLLPGLLAGSAAGSGKGNLADPEIQKLLDGLKQGSGDLPSDLQSLMGELSNQLDQAADPPPQPAP